MSHDVGASRTTRNYLVVPVLGGLELLSATYDAHAFPPHAQETLVLGTVELGRIVVECEGHSLTVAPGDVLVLAPGVIHSAWPVDGALWKYRALYLTEVQRRSIALESEHQDAPSIAGGTVLRDGDVAASLLRAYDSLAQSSTDPAAADGGRTALTAVLGECERALRSSVRALPVGGRIERVRAHIEQNLHRRVTLDELAETAGMSRFGFVRAFSAAMGVSPYAYSMQRRLDHARRLLVDTSDISMTAHRLGFADQSHFTRWFLRVVGVTPGEYVRAQASIPRPARARGTSVA